MPVENEPQHGGNGDPKADCIPETGPPPPPPLREAQADPWAKELLEIHGIRLIFFTPITLFIATILLAWFSPDKDDISPERYSIEWFKYNATTFAGLGFLIVFTYLSMLLIKMLQPINDKGVVADEPQRSKTLFGRHFVVICFVLFFLAVNSVIAISGLAQSGRLPLPGLKTEISVTDPKPKTPSKSASGDPPKMVVQNDDSRTSPTKPADAPAATAENPLEVNQVGYLLAASLLMAIIGALFFVANSLNEKRQDESEVFDQNVFWGGVWFRIGEAVVFVLVVFLFIAYQTELSGSLAAGLPVLSLLMGMFAKSGERLIFGIANKLFEAASALLPNVTQIDNEVPGNARNLSVTAESASNTLRLNWDEPLTGGKVVSYQIFRTPDVANKTAEQRQLIAENTFADRKLSINLADATKTPFYYYVVAKNAKGTSHPSNVVKYQ